MTQTRAVLRVVEPAHSGVEALCVACNEGIVWSARKKQTKVVCNIYDNGIWNRVDQFHDSCYSDAGQPYGEAIA